MIRDPPSQGSIVAYPYLWRKQHYDILERSFYFDVKSPPFDSFRAKFLGKVAASFKSTLKTTTGRVDRTEI